MGTIIPWDDAADRNVEAEGDESLGDKGNRKSNDFLVVGLRVEKKQRPRTGPLQCPGKQEKRESCGVK